MNVTLYAPMTKEEAALWHLKLSECCGVTMSQNPEIDGNGNQHTFFTLHQDAEQPETVKEPV